LIIKLYESLNLKWYQELPLILIAFYTNGFTVQVVISQYDLFKNIWKYGAAICYSLGVYIVLVLIFVSFRDLVTKRFATK